MILGVSFLFYDSSLFLLVGYIVFSLGGGERIVGGLGYGRRVGIAVVIVVFGD